MRDLYNNSTPKALVAAVNTGYSLEEANSLSVNGTAIDLKGEAGKCLLIVTVGATSTATAILTIKSGTDNSTFGTTETTVLLDTTGTTVVDFTPTNRYIRAEYSVSETAVVAEACYITFEAIGVFYDERYRPSNVS